ASRHPERRCQPGDDQRRARPDQIVAAVSLDRDAGELALTEKAVLVITHPDALALVELDGLGFEAGECQQGRSRRCWIAGCRPFGCLVGAVNDVAELESGLARAILAGREGHGEFRNERIWYCNSLLI